MKKRFDFKNKLLIIALIIVMIISGTFAYTSYEVATVENDVVSGAVNIDLLEYVEKNGEFEEVDAISQNVIPEEEIPLQVKVHNKGIKSYVRVKYEYDNIEFSSSDINISDNWSKKGDYYYYDKVVNEDEYIELFNGYTIPKEILGDYKFIITAEAVQSEYFEVDIDSDQPWGDFKPEKSIDDSYDITKIDVAGNTVVDYKDNSKQFIEIPSNFMENISLLKPGDKLEDYITINNKSKKEIEVFMKNIDLSNESNDIYKYIKLKVYNEKNKVIYNGNILQDSLTSLGKYKVNETERLRFVVEFSEENKNVTSIKDFKIGWKFYISEIEDKTIKDAVNPGTGDGIVFWIIIFVISTSLLITMIKSNIYIKNID